MVILNEFANVGGKEITVHHQECEEPTSFTVIHSKIRQKARLCHFIKIPKIDLAQVTVKSQALTRVKLEIKFSSKGHST